MQPTIDFHIHTSASDGTYSPRRLIDEVLKKQLACFAVTDHDETRHVDEVGALARAYGIGFLRGVEISAVHQGRIYHITTYGCDFDTPMLNDVLRHNNEVWHNIDLARIHSLSTTETHADLAEFLAYRHDESRGGWRSLNYMLDKGIVSDLDEYFSFSFPGTYQSDFTPLADVLKAIRSAGGLAFLAHPAYYKTTGSFFSYENLDTLFSLGIDGLECYTTYNTSEEEARYYQHYATAHGLLISGGSDCHGDFIPARKLGRPAITVDMVGSWFEKYIQ